ncbi:hypothetical protein BH11MYX4_BH11MYX4_32630 [soil metagenome]
MLGVTLGAAATATAWAVQHVLTRPPPPPRVGKHLDAVNDAFHEAYDSARDSAELSAPVMIVLADKLVVVNRRLQQEWDVRPELFHVIKSAAHGPVALFARLVRLEDAHPAAAAEASLLALRDHLAAAMADVHGSDPEAVDAIRAVLADTLAFLETSDFSARARGAFTAAMGPQLLALTFHATRLQLRALDERVAEALATLIPEEQRRLQIVVTGDHQARERSLAMQYFEKRLGAENAEGRLAYGESITDVEEALALVGRRRLDATIARAFFGDAKRLQRDVLGDAAHALLAARDFEPIP